MAGVVAQHPDSVRRFIEDTGLAFDVLIDERRDVLRAYGVWHRIGLDAWNIARPALFLVDRDRRVLYSRIADNQREFPAHADILQAIQTPLRP